MVRFSAPRSGAVLLVQNEWGYWTGKARILKWFRKNPEGQLGGIGSGRHSGCGSRDTTEDYMPIDIRRWHQEGLLTPYRSFGSQRTSISSRIMSMLLMSTLVSPVTLPLAQSDSNSALNRPTSFLTELLLILATTICTTSLNNTNIIPLHFWTPWERPDKD